MIPAPAETWRQSRLSGQTGERTKMMAADNTDVRARMRPFREPIILAMVALVTLSNILPRNPVWGVRTRETMASQAAWEHGNRLGGLATLAASSIWILAAVYLPRRYVKPVGIVAVLLAFAILFISQGWSI
jgi:uncharacterized membrane protein